MRRKEFEITHPEMIDRFLRSQRCGVLTLSDVDVPYSVPLNYAWDGERILIHSSPDGRKASLLKKGDLSQFTVYREYSVIPSWFTDEKDPCHATQFFASVMVTGKTGELSDIAEKASALNLIMDQVQGRGRYEPLSASNERCLAMLSHTAVFFLKSETITGKFKFGQNLGEEKSEFIMEKLLERGTDLDRETVSMMKELRRK